MSEVVLPTEIARRRTFAIIAHPDAGKTTLTEKLQLYCGAIQIAATARARGAPAGGGPGGWTGRAAGRPRAGRDFMWGIGPAMAVPRSVSASCASASDGCNDSASIARW